MTTTDKKKKAVNEIVHITHTGGLVVSQREYTKGDEHNRMTDETVGFYVHGCWSLLSRSEQEPVF